MVASMISLLGVLHALGKIYDPMAQEIQVPFGVPTHASPNFDLKFGLRWHIKILSYLKIWSNSHAAHCTPWSGNFTLVWEPFPSRE